MQGQQPKIMIAAGGTGGHVIPALAVAEVLQGKGFQIHWIGTKLGIEHRLVPLQNYPISYIDISGIRGKGVAIKLKAPFRILKSIWQMIKIYKDCQPDAVLTMGGYVSGPAGVAAWLKRIPLLIHEQNAIAGLTNKVLAKFANKVMLAYPNSIRGVDHKCIVTGNPLREIFLNEGSAVQQSDEEQDKFKILVLGGSLGALKLNEVVPEAIQKFDRNKRPIVWHQTGDKHLKSTEKFYRDAKVEARLFSFIEDMAKAYQWADMVICRAGALTVAEVAQMGKPCIFIPFPFAVDDHQTQNAKYLSEQGAAILLPQAALTPHQLYQILGKFEHKPTRDQMSEKAKSLSKPMATQHVAEQCIQVLAPTQQL